MKQSISIEEQIVAGKTIAQWDYEWKDIPGGFLNPGPGLNGQAGLYCAVEHGEVVVIGHSAGSYSANRLHKRLYDLRRPGDSGRNCRAGHFIHAHMDVLDLRVLLIGKDRDACRITQRLRPLMLKLHNPRENVPASIKLARMQARFENNASRQ